MCGIAGFIDISLTRNASKLDALATAMADSIVHRGPDDSGTFVLPEAGVAFAFRRLSIVDLTASGHQPMVSADGRWTIVFNGEIYNAEVLRGEAAAPGHTYRGHSDTEVILEYMARHGFEKAVSKTVGMFAIAAFDRETRTTWFARDRLGKKPLYLGEFGKTLLFASELRSMRVHPDFRGELDPQAVAAYTRFGYVPHPLCIYRGVQQLPPGSIACHRSGSPLRVQSYWTPEDIAEANMKAGYEGDEHQAVEDLDRLLRDAVRIRMMADVPLGAFLSGGIDSSLVVALMQVQSKQPVRTFSIGFNVAGYDEAPHARAVAQHLKTDHTELYLSPEDALAVIPKLADIYDEPFADSSQIPTFMVSELARRHVTVALSGDGGDELFAGYNRYSQIQTQQALAQSAPALVGPLATAGLSVMGSRLFSPARRIVPGRVLSRGERLLTRLADAAKPNSFEANYIWLAQQGRPPAEFLANNAEMLHPIWFGALASRFPHPVQRAQVIDLMTYLPDDILVKVDRASMAISLEVRAPLLDHRVAEFAWRLPLGLKMRNGESKWVLRQVLYRYVPREIIERPKMGFGVPIDHWLRGPLRDWAEGLLSAERLRREGVFNVEAVRGLWERHLAGETWQYPIWCVLMFQAWRSRWLDC